MFMKQIGCVPGEEGSLPPAGFNVRQSISNLSRRSMLLGSGGLVVGVALAGCAAEPDLVIAEPTEPAGPSPLTDVTGGDATPSLWIEITPAGAVKFTCHRSEMGQQAWTSMAQIAVDELDADWADVEIVQAVGHPKYGDQNTDGSRSVRFNFHRLRVAGAAMRTMLIQTAANTWEVDAATLETDAGAVVNPANRKRLTYGQLASAAAKMQVPAEDDIRLKARKDWRYIGKPVASMTVPKVIRGQGVYGIDVERPDMVYAVIAHPPQVFGKTGAVNDTAALAIPGVLQTVTLPNANPPALFQALGGVAVVGTDTWAAIQGRNALEVTWEDGPSAAYHSAPFEQAMAQTARNPGDVRQSRGDVYDGLETSETRVSADYYVPFFAHASMEPPAATAEWTGDTLECWACVQDPQNTRRVLAGIFAIPEDNITVHATWLGGAFGRKSKPDFVVEAALIAKEVGKPVKVTWTREDDLRHDYYHSVAAQHLEAGLESDGTCSAFLHRSVFPPIASTFAAGADNPTDGELGLGASDNPFNVPNFQLETGRAPAHLRIGWLRSVSNIFHAFAVQSFASELAAAAGRDPKDYLLDLIGPARMINPADDGIQYANYSASLDDYPIDTGRLTNAANVAADMAGWGRDLPDGHGLGIAVHRSFLSYIATVVEVAVDADGQITMPHIWLACDAGTVVNPRHTRAQLEGGTLYGLSNALYGEITAQGGAVQQSNFPDYRLMRMNEAPRKFDVEIIASDAPPAGVGEPATPPAAPALTNAIFAASGVRIRRLPILGPNGTALQTSTQDT